MGTHTKAEKQRNCIKCGRSIMHRRPTAKFCKECFRENERGYYMKNKTKQVSLIIPKDQNPEKPVMFLGVLYLASYLKERGIPVKIYDDQLGEVWDKLDEIKEKSMLIGFTIMTSQLKSAKEYSQLFHKEGIPIVWGGYHPLLFQKQCIREECVDYLLYDEGEQSLLELAQNIRDKKTIKGILGIWYKDNGEIKKNAPMPYIDINTVSPDWSLIDITKYNSQVYYDGDKKDTFPLHVGRGCPYRCTFCINTLLNDRKYRGMTAEKIVKDIKELMKIKDLTNLTFVDENFFMDLDRVKEFCKMYKREHFKFTWIGTSRVNYILNMSDEFLKELRDCGCVLFRMGIESGNQRVLDEVIQKDIKKDDVIKAIEKLKKADISAECSFMAGMPGETVEEQKDTFDLFKKLVKMWKKVHVIGPQLYRPYPGAEMYQQAKKAGFNEPKTVDEWIGFMNKFGFLDINQLTWIPNKKVLMSKCKYFAWSQINPKGLAKPLGLLFRTMFRLRMKLDAYSFPIDIWLYEHMKEVYIKTKGG